MTIENIETESSSAGASAVSWAAIAGGALVAIAATLVLFSLGSGLGLAAASPWSKAADTAGAVGVFTGIWLIIVQWASSAVGGYLTGRLRTRWIGTHTHEVFFRDTAHGFLTWAFATVVIGAVAVWAGAGVTGTTATVTSAHEVGAPNLAYDADTLYRTPTGDQSALSAERAEAERILTASALRGGLGDDDRAYLIASIANRTGATPIEAARRVDQVENREQQAATEAKVVADKARKAAAALAILTSLSLVIGAFIASVAAALGGQERDLHP
jgi:hypothetical protein